MRKAQVPGATPDTDQVFKPAEAADFCKCSKNHLERLRVTGGGPKFSRIGSRIIRYRRSELLRWLAEREVSSTSEKQE